MKSIWEEEATMCIHILYIYFLFIYFKIWHMQSHPSSEAHTFFPVFFTGVEETHSYIRADRSAQTASWSRSSNEQRCIPHICPSDTTSGTHHSYGAASHSRPWHGSDSQTSLLPSELPSSLYCTFKQ